MEAQERKRNPVSKVFFTDVSGEALIDTGETIHDVSRRSVFSAQGSVIETRRAAHSDSRTPSFSTMVYSNGTGAFFDSDTRVEVRRFVQEPFTPQRTDMDVEPSISQTQAFVARGTVGLCTSKLVAGSNMTYQTPHGSVNIRGRKVVIETEPELTRISMLEGESVVRAGPQDMGGHTIRAGEQAILRRGSAGQPNSIQITPIPRHALPALDDKVAMACLAKRTVYFEERVQVPGDSVADGSEDAAGAGAVTAFDGAADGGTTLTEIVAVEVVPEELPVQFTISPAQIILTSGQDRSGG